MKEKFWTVVCDHMPRLRILLAALFVLLALTVFSIVNTTPGTASHTVAVIDMVLVTVAIAIGLFLQWRCGKNERRRGEWRPENQGEE